MTPCDEPDMWSCHGERGMGGWGSAGDSRVPQQLALLLPIDDSVTCSDPLIVLVLPAWHQTYLVESQVWVLDIEQLRVSTDPKVLCCVRAEEPIHRLQQQGGGVPASACGCKEHKGAVCQAGATHISIAQPQCLLDVLSGDCCPLGMFGELLRLLWGSRQVE